MSGIVRSSIFVLIFVVSVPFATSQSLDGFWRSEGYGYVFEVTAASLKALDVTTTTCVFEYAAPRDRGAVAGREATFRTKEGDVYFIKTGGSADHTLAEGLISLSKGAELLQLPLSEVEADLKGPQNGNANHRE